MLTVFLKQIDNFTPDIWYVAIHLVKKKRILQKYTSISLLSDFEYCCYVYIVF